MMWTRTTLTRGVSALGAMAFGVWIAWQLLAAGQGARHSGATAVSTVPAPAASRPAGSSAPAAAGALPGTDASAARHPQPLLLLATAPGRTLSESTATLGTDARNPQTYAGGALLANGARIVEIRARDIVLSWRGTHTVLAMTAPGAAPPTAAPPALLIGGVTEQSVAAAPPTTREDLSQYLRPQPRYERGRLVGLQVFAGTDAARLALLGLMPGDVIRTVSGLPVTEHSWSEIDDVLSSRGSIVVGVERDGALTTVSLDGTQFAEPGPAT